MTENVNLDIFLTILLGLVFSFCVFVYKVTYKGRGHVDRLHDLQRRNHMDAEKGGFQIDIVDLFTSLLSKMGAQLKLFSQSEAEKVRLSFEKAGWRRPGTAIIFTGMKILCALMLSALFFLSNEVYFSYEGNQLLVLLLAGLILGSILTDYILKWMIRSRQQRLKKAFPDALDLLVLCSEAGLNLAASFQRVAREITVVSPDLAYEFAVTAVELSIIPDRRVALENLARRLDFPGLRNIVGTLIQSEQYGTPIVQAFRSIAQEFRSFRALSAEEKGGRIPSLLSIPLIICILPAFVLIMMAPSFAQIYRSYIKVM